MPLINTFGAASSKGYGFGNSLVPSMNLNLLSGAISSLVSFTRATTATVTDFEGLIKNTRSGEVRFDGMRRVENLFTYSQDFSNAAWTKYGSVGISVNSGTAPDNTQTATTFTLAAGVNQSQGFYYNSIPAIAGNYTQSIYVKPIGSQMYFAFVGFDSLSTSYNLATLQVTSGEGGTSTGSITAVGNGWYRLTRTATSTAGTQYPVFIAIPTYPRTGGSASWTPATAEKTLIWGAQLENVTGQSNQNPSEYVSRNVLSAPYQGANVDGVQYFPYTNPNCIINGAITQIPTIAINSSNSKWAYNCTASGDYFSTPSSAANQITGNLSLLVQVALDDWTPATVQTLVAKDGVSAGTRSWAFNIQTSGAPRLNYSLDGTNIISVTASASTDFTDRTVHFIGVQREASTGIVRFYTSEDGRTFTQLGTDQTGTAGSLYNASTQPVQFGNLSSLSFALDGRIYDSHIYSGLKFTGTSTMVVDFDPSNWTVGQGNLLTYSSQFDNSAWNKQANVVVTQANAEIAPDGTLTADLVTFSGTTNNSLYQGSTTAAFETRVASVYIKGTAGQTLSISWQPPGGSAFKTLTLTGAWDRVSVAATSGATSGGGNMAISVRPGETATAVYIWGAQLTQTSSVVPYLPTTSAAIPSGFIGLETGEVWTLNGNAKIYQGLWDAVGPKSMLIEEARTNLLTYSDQFDNVAWVKTGASTATNSIIAPDGTLTGDSLIEDTSTGNHYISQPSVSVTSGTAYTFSIYVKASGRSRVQIYGGSTSFNKNATFNLSTGAVVSTSWELGTTITSAGGGWYRCTVSGAAIATVTGTIFVYLDNGSTNNYTGDGTSGIYIWGASLEQGAFATSYIPTTSAQVTRNADQASMTGTNFSSWYNQSAGTAYCDFDMLNTSANSMIPYSIENGTSNGYMIYKALSAVTMFAYAGANNAQIVAVTVANTQYKTGLAYGVDIAATANGATPFSIATGGLSGGTPNQLLFGKSFAGNQLSGHIRTIRYYNQRLPNTTLQSLTA